MKSEMKITMTRREAIRMFGAAAPMLALGKRVLAEDGPTNKIAPGPFKPTRDSLHAYSAPDWFADAKFGIWAHWGPQSAVEDGDWYARNMYMQGSPQNLYHVETYGPPSKFGFKDTIPAWKAAKWDPDHLISMYKKAGAKYFVSMGCHHDNFDLWNSKYTRWNSVNMGPKKDIVGMWKKAATAQGLKFGVSEHLWISYKWFAVSHGADKTGPLAGVPYDGVDPATYDLYHDANMVQFLGERLQFDDDDIPMSWKQHYLNRIDDLVNNYQPDLLYTDGHLPFEEYGLSMVSNLYNVSSGRSGGKTTAVYNSKRPNDCEVGTCVLDRERGVLDDISANPWQTDTCIGDWHYKRGIQYKTPKKVVDLLVDIVSKNGNLLLNFPLPNSGQLDAEEMVTLDGITRWMAVNSEGIHSSRPWKIYGEGPSTKTAPADAASTNFNENKKPELSAEDIRFTKKGNDLYVFVMGTAAKEAVIRALGTSSAQQPGQISNVQMLGYEGKLDWKQDANSLKVQMPSQKPSDHAVTLKVQMA